MDQIFWDMRYSLREYVYGTKPNRFLEESLAHHEIKEKSILFPAEGEGRNAVHAAQLGMNVLAFDYKPECIL